MKANSVIFMVIAFFFFVIDAVYIIWSTNTPTLIANGQPGEVEWVGAIALGLCGILGALISFFVWRSYAGQGGELPEDILDSEISDGDAEQGFFSPWSWWPIMLAGSATIVALGIAIGFWISFIGVAILIVSLVGWQYEYYRGRFVH